VITPFATIASQALNVFAQDTATLGDIHLAKDSVVLVPHSFDVSENFPFAVQKRLPGESLREGVERVIRENDFIPIEMADGSSMNGDRALLPNGQDINQGSIFDQVKQALPRIEAGSPMRHPFHQYYFYSFVMLEKVFGRHGAEPTRPGDLKNLISAIKSNIATAQRLSQKKYFSPTERDLVNKVSQDLSDYNRLLELELDLQTKHNISLSKLNHDEKREIIALRNDPQALQIHVQHILSSQNLDSRLKIYKNRQPGLDNRRLGSLVQHLPVSSFKKFTWICT